MWGSNQQHCFSIDFDSKHGFIASALKPLLGRKGAANYVNHDSAFEFSENCLSYCCIHYSRHPEEQDEERLIRPRITAIAMVRKDFSYSDCSRMD